MSEVPKINESNYRCEFDAYFIPSVIEGDFPLLGILSSLSVDTGLDGEATEGTVRGTIHLGRLSKHKTLWFRARNQLGSDKAGHLVVNRNNGIKDIKYISAYIEQPDGSDYTLCGVTSEYTKGLSPGNTLLCRRALTIGASVLSIAARYHLESGENFGHGQPIPFSPS